VQLEYERVGHPAQDVGLADRILQILAFDQMLLALDLHGKLNLLGAAL